MICTLQHIPPKFPGSKVCKERELTRGEERTGFFFCAAGEFFSFVPHEMRFLKGLLYRNAQNFRLRRYESIPNDTMCTTIHS